MRYTTSAQRGGVNTFFNLNEPSSLRAVEALRGPNSAQYGSDSLGGTVGTTAGRTAVSTGRPVVQQQSEVSNNFDASVLYKRGRWRAEATGFLIDINNAITKQALILPAGSMGASSATSPSRASSRTASSSSRSRWRPCSCAPTSRTRASTAQSLDSTRRSRATSRPRAASPTSTRRTRRRACRRTSRAGRPRRTASCARGLVAPGPDGRCATGDETILIPTGETLSQVQNRLLGSATSAPLFAVLPGYGLVGIRGRFKLSENSDLQFELDNLADKNYRGISWGIDGPGRSFFSRYRLRF